VRLRRYLKKNYLRYYENKELQEPERRKSKSVQQELQERNSHNSSISNISHSNSTEIVKMEDEN